MPAELDQRSKMEKLRALRLSDEAARQAAGTWGEMSLGEITHRPSGEVFVYYWKGRELPRVEELPGKRTIARRADEHALLRSWLLKHDLEGFEVMLLAWSLSEAEAIRLQHAKVGEHNAVGRVVINAGPTRALAG